MKKKSNTKEIPNSRERFPAALRALIEERGISYRRLATRTKLSAGYLNHLAQGTRSTPSEKVIRNIARALRVKPEYFIEFRQRAVGRELYKAPEILDMLYDFLFAGKPLPRDFKATVEKSRKK